MSERHVCIREESYWLTDCKGIPLDRVCDKCVETKKSHYNKRVFEGYEQSDIDEQIEPEEY
jgi:hypothetical protein